MTYLSCESISGGKMTSILSLFRSNGKGVVEGIKTKNNTLYGQKAIIIAAGCWTGSLIHELLRESDTKVNIPVQPRKVRIFHGIER